MYRLYRKKWCQPRTSTSMQLFQWEPKTPNFTACQRSLQILSRVRSILKYCSILFFNRRANFWSVAVALGGWPSTHHLFVQWKKLFWVQFARLSLSIICCWWNMDFFLYYIINENPSKVQLWAVTRTREKEITVTSYYKFFRCSFLYPELIKHRICPHTKLKISLRRGHDQHNSISKWAMLQ